MNGISKRNANWESDVLLRLINYFKNGHEKLNDNFAPITQTLRSVSKYLDWFEKQNIKWSGYNYRGPFLTYEQMELMFNYMHSMGVSGFRGFSDSKIFDNEELYLLLSSMYPIPKEPRLYGIPISLICCAKEEFLSDKTLSGFFRTFFNGALLPKYFVTYLYMKNVEVSDFNKLESLDGIYPFDFTEETLFWMFRSLYQENPANTRYNSNITINIISAILRKLDPEKNLSNITLSYIFNAIRIAPYNTCRDISLKNQLVEHILSNVLIQHSNLNLINLNLFLEIISDKFLTKNGMINLLSYCDPSINLKPIFPELCRVSAMDLKKYITYNENTTVCDVLVVLRPHSTLSNIISTEKQPPLENQTQYLVI